MPMIFAANEDLNKTIKELLDSEGRAGLGKNSNTKRAIVMSGLTQIGLHRLMSIYRLSELPSPLWASLTPISENWSVSHLIDELAEESRAMKRRKKGQGVTNINSWEA